ncbi:hypothetical protein ACFY0B_14800 [Streptomyces sp. NPDC001797]|uniref:hypothetical protein n=1 Tax=Streptomyces sp. NPDC001797 TaxID=3364610 RepID=UPI0036B9792A
MLLDRGGDFLAVEVAPVVQGGAPGGFLLPQLLVGEGEVRLSALERGQTPPGDVHPDQRQGGQQG